MSRQGTPKFNIGMWDDKENPGAGSKVADNNQLNGNWLKIDAALGKVGDTLIEVDESAIGDEKILVYNAATGKLEYQEKPTGGGSKPDFLLDIPAGSWDYPDADIAPLDQDTGTNHTQLRNLFDDTAVEGVIIEFQVPPDIDITKIPSLELYGYAVTAPGEAKSVFFSCDAAVIKPGETWDQALANIGSGEGTPSQDQDEVDFTEFDCDLVGLGATAGDIVRLKLSRTHDDGDLVGDYALTHARLRIPRS